MMKTTPPSTINRKNNKNTTVKNLVDVFEQLCLYDTEIVYTTMVSETQVVTINDECTNHCPKPGIDNDNDN